MYVAVASRASLAHPGVDHPLPLTSRKYRTSTTTATTSPIASSRVPSHSRNPSQDRASTEDIVALERFHRRIRRRRCTPPSRDWRHATILVSVEAEKQCDESDYGDPDREDEGRCKHEGPDARITRDGSSGATSPSFDRGRPRAPLRILLELPDDIRLTVSLLRHSPSVGRPFAPL